MAEQINEEVADALLALVDAASSAPKNAVASAFASVGPSSDFMETELAAAGVTEADLARIGKAIDDAVRDGNVATFNKIAKAAIGVLGGIKDIIA